MNSSACEGGKALPITSVLYWSLYVLANLQTADALFCIVAAASIESSFLPQFTPVSLFAHETDSTSRTRSSGFRIIIYLFFFNVNVQTYLETRDHFAARLNLCIIIFISMVKHLE